MTLTIKAEDLLATLTPLAPVYHRAGRLQSKVRLDWDFDLLSASAAATPAYSTRWVEGTRSTDKAKGSIEDILVDYKPLVGMVALSDSPSDKVEMAVEGGSLVVRTPLFRTRIPAEVPPVSDADKRSKYAYQLPTWHDLDAVTWKAPALYDAFKFVSGAASSDEARPVLTNVLVHGVSDGRIALAGTDSYRLSVLELAGDAPEVGGGGFLLPGRAARHLPREETEFVIHSEPGGPFSWVEWNHDGTHWKMQSAGEGSMFPNYRGLIPSGDAPVVVNLDRDVALRTFNRAQKFIKLVGLWSNHTPVRLSIDKVGMSVDVVSSETKTPTEFGEYVNCDTHGEMDVAFNAEFFLNGLKAIQAPMVKLSLWGGSKPAVLSSEGFTYLVMPVRLPEGRR